MYLALADSFDASVSLANDKLDMAEHALAVARGSLGGHNPMSLQNPRLTRAAAQQLEFYKNEVADARRNLMRVLKQRRTLVSFQQPLA